MAATKKKSFREIARSLNVSPATVSRIAAGIGSFSEETRQTVLAALEAEGYSLQAEKEPQVPALPVSVSVPQVPVLPVSVSVPPTVRQHSLHWRVY